MSFARSRLHTILLLLFLPFSLLRLRPYDFTGTACFGFMFAYFSHSQTEALIAFQKFRYHPFIMRR